MDGLSTYPFAILDPPRFAAYRDQTPESRDTVVGNDCWIGRGATLLPGATHGYGVVVGAGAVVAGNAPPLTILAGNPARVVRKRFPDEIAARLGRLAWWNWAPQRIAAAIEALEAGDIDALETAAPD